MTMAETWTVVAAIASSVSGIAAAFSLWLVRQQITEAKNANYAQAFIAASERLQAETARADRATTFLLADKPYAQWTEAEKATAQRVVQLLDVVAVMVHEGMLPKKVILENWGDTYRRTWKCAKDHVDFVRKRADDPTFFLRFEWIADQANTTHKQLASTSTAQQQDQGSQAMTGSTHPAEIHSKGERVIVDDKS